MSEAAIPVSVVRGWMERMREEHPSMWVDARYTSQETRHSVNLYAEIEAACVDAERAALREP